MDDANRILGVELTADLIEKYQQRALILNALTFPINPRDRRSHLKPRRVLRFLKPRRVWDETAAEHAARIAALPPEPPTLVFRYERQP